MTKQEFDARIAELEQNHGKELDPNFDTDLQCYCDRCTEEKLAEAEESLKNADQT
jgi:hypothetical protein